MCVRDMWVVQWYCVFEGLVEMCEVVGMELYWKLIAKMLGLVCEVGTGFLRGCFYWRLVIESNSVNSGTEVLIENVCIKWHVLQTYCFPANEDCTLKKF